MNITYNSLLLYLVNCSLCLSTTGTKDQELNRHHLCTFVIFLRIINKKKILLNEVFWLFQKLVIFFVICHENSSQVRFYECRFIVYIFLNYTFYKQTITKRGHNKILQLGVARNVFPQTESPLSFNFLKMKEYIYLYRY